MLEHIYICHDKLTAFQNVLGLVFFFLPSLIDLTLIRFYNNALDLQSNFYFYLISHK